MKRFLKQVYLHFILAALTALPVLAQNFPERSNRLVNDYTGTLTAGQISSIENKLVAFDDSTSTQIAVVVIKSLGGYDVADYAVRLAEKWGVGRDKKNNGVILLVSLEDRKVTIQTGYGVEGALPDAIARRIIENEIKPDFKDGNYAAGIDKGTDAIISYTKGEYKNESPKKTRSKGTSLGWIIPIIFVILILISRGGRGGGGQIIGRRGSASPFWWFLMGSALGGSGRSSGGGFGGFSGGGGGGGGFGGFGGGSFGGGGASGSW